ncbi:hypothetical protein [Mesoflavibacter zeaxanthinifaciens]|uniref:hypothetical protein n=1 Tax=Mesoflavibacter zeaxanthinifaciens TaxID=393060 RepID=UPI0026EB6B26|nr:hypothetical protein [Mesoflavibacter zeaxanthinifaciens]
MKIDTNQLEVYMLRNKYKLNDPVSIFVLKYDYEKFVSNIETPSKFFKRLTNSKSAIPGFGSNREWWKKHQPNGMYRYRISDNEIEIKFFVESKKPLNERELKLRLFKILKPIGMEFHLNDYDYFIGSISDLLEEVKEKIQMFGGMKRKDLESLKNLNDIINMDYFKELTANDEA